MAKKDEKTEEVAQEESETKPEESEVEKVTAESEDNGGNGKAGAEVEEIPSHILIEFSKDNPATFELRSYQCNPGQMIAAAWYLERLAEQKYYEAKQREQAEQMRRQAQMQQIMQTEKTRKERGKK